MDKLDLELFDSYGLEELAQRIPVPNSAAGLGSLSDEFNEVVRPKGFGFGPKDYWNAFCKEMRLLICGGEGGEKYSDLRRKLAAHGKKSQTALISTVAVFVGSEISVEAALLTPYIAIFLAVGIRVSQEVLCQALKRESQ